MFHRQRLDPWCPVFGPTIVLSLVLLGLGCGTAPAPPTAGSTASTPAARPNVLFISLDTLRRDAVGLHRTDETGPSPTPNLDAFARDAVIFDDAVAPMPFTLASHMSMFSGLYPDVHKVREPKRQLAADVAMLPALLRDAGYFTVGFYTNDWMKPSFGFDRGFDRYERVPHRLTFADRLNQQLFDTIDAAPEDQPWFVFLHYFDAHSDNTVRDSTLPYYAPAPFLDDLGIPPTDQRFCHGEACATAYLLNLNNDDLPLSAAEIETLEALYDRGVRYLDDRIGFLLDGLRRRDQYRDTIIIVISDHGEEFREHGRLIHSQPYVETVAIPLMIKLRNQARAGDRVALPTETIDVLPTLFGVLDLPVPSLVQGSDQLADVDPSGDVVDGRRLALAQDKHNFQRYALYSPTHALVVDYKADTVELYDRRDDPGMQRNVADAEPARREALRAKLDTLLRTNRQAAKHLTSPVVESEALTHEEQERLKSLGYLNG